MKTVIILSVLLCGNAFANETLKELQKKHRAMRHEERKKWDRMDADCKVKHPKMYDSSHPDYDAGFKCREEIADAKDAFQESLDAEICQKVGVACKKEGNLR